MKFWLPRKHHCHSISKIEREKRRLIVFSRFVGGEEQSICGAGRMHCYRDAEEELLRRTTMEQCNCLPACTSTDYNVEVSEREFDEYNRINADMNYQR